ncbi:MAG TPA: hypothetical protein VF522_24295 [Ramlibacter sp.]|uniref:hypothetical protein n=1 Tax=Ramlibacter sp. TaxID=1917967 RepID=UPI002ED24277
MSLAVALLLASTAAQCAPEGATLQVGARVQRHATIRMAQPLTFTISDADIARGFVEVESPVQLSVQSNVDEGYTLSFACRCEEVRRARVRGLSSELSVGQAPVLAARPAAGRGVWRDSVQLRVRFDLAPQARPGEHAWPLGISMMSE